MPTTNYYRMNYNLPPGPKINLGCGPVQPAGWINIDGSNRAWMASKLSFFDNLLVKLKVIPPTEFNPSIIYCNLLKGIPYPNNSISCIYSGELWEHFEFEDAVGEEAPWSKHRRLFPGSESAFARGPGTGQAVSSERSNGA